jgi:hypothetical protein
MVPPLNDVAVLSRSTRVGLLLVVLSLISCAAPPAAEKSVRLNPDAVPPPLAPSTCRFTGTITEILPVEKTNGRGACMSVPCLALVRIDTVYGCGAAFVTPLSAGTIVRIRFTLTLQPTRALFPAMRDLPPPLGKGDELTAIMTAREIPSTAGDTMEYSIDSYFMTNRPESTR